MRMSNMRLGLFKIVGILIVAPHSSFGIQRILIVAFVLLVNELGFDVNRNLYVLVTQTYLA